MKLVRAFNEIIFFLLLVIFGIIVYVTNVFDPCPRNNY